jgi:uncharacterized membrane protein YphA (DoxX/SURF4 family)
MKILRVFCRIIVGLVFIFSGIVKAVDPLGSAYKFADYFQAFNLDFLQPVALALAIVLCTAEFISGFSVLSGYKLKWGIWGVMVLMLIFTPLTLILAFNNPVSDCGCFGDAIHLTNWQTFGKNLILIAFTVILFIGRKEAKQLFNPLKEWAVISLITLLFVCFSLLNLRYLPLFDFLPYENGVNIPESMKIPEGKPPDEYKTTFIYEKNGSRKEFTLENYPADDSTWKFIDQKSVLIKKGYTPPIHDFSITSPDGDDLTGKILSNEGYTFLMISKKLAEARRTNLEKGFELGTQCHLEGIGFYIITASGTEEVKEFGNGFSFCSADETMLKTIVRANPGFVLLKGGTIQGKWSWSNLPAKELFVKNMTEEQIRKINNKSSVLVVYSLAILVIVFLLLISSFLRRNKGGSEKGYLRMH